MKAYVDLQLVLQPRLFQILVDMRSRPYDTITERAKRFGIRKQNFNYFHQKLIEMGLVRKVGRGKYIPILDSKINDPVEQAIKTQRIPRKAKRTFKSKL